MKLFHPELFQGNLRKKRYFEGWYFKHVSYDLSSVYAFIPGVSLAEGDSHSFIQVIDGIRGSVTYCRYDLRDFSSGRGEFLLRVGGSVFTEKYIELDIRDEFLRISGRIDYSNLVRYPKSLLAPGIMGWYSYVPLMECKHGILSAHHDLRGTLTIDKKETDFTGGSGYIEKDWGKSFPEAWVWLQCNNFTMEDASLSVSIAKIPWLGSFFMGFIAFLCVRGRFHIFATYNKSVIARLEYDRKILSLELGNRDNVLDIKVITHGSGVLRAPVEGKMSRRIKESIDSEVFVRLRGLSGNVLFEDSGKRAGLEIIEKIFGYFPGVDLPPRG